VCRTIKEESHVCRQRGYGNTGSVVVKTLRAAGKSVRAIVRDAAKAKTLAELGAELFVADLTDHAALARACEGQRSSLTARR
jgi:uncharacterized protein YbjT (DUF2867 family)